MIMNYLKDTPKFFLGANSPFGFFSRFDNLYDPEKGYFCYILKGGPGSGKSSLMKKIAARAVNRDFQVELIYCPSDPNSLDAVILPEKKVSIVDGTAPHTMDPAYPGASDEIINLGEFWDSHIISSKKDDVLRLSRKSLLFRTRSTGYLKACKSIKSDIINIASNAINEEKVLDYSRKLTKKLFKKVSDLKGRETIKFISAVTPDGIIFFEDTISLMCEKIYIIDDCFGVVSPIILSYLRNAALNLGHNVITCYCPLDPKNKIESLIFPDDSIAFAVSNKNHSLENLKNGAKKINATRFLDRKVVSSHLRLLNFDRKIELELLNEAIKNLNKAKSIHDEIESIYVPAMNFKLIDKISKQLIEEIF